MYRNTQIQNIEVQGLTKFFILDSFFVGRLVFDSLC